MELSTRKALIDSIIKEINEDIAIASCMDAESLTESKFKEDSIVNIREYDLNAIILEQLKYYSALNYFLMSQLSDDELVKMQLDFNSFNESIQGFQG
jgi:hypothetical protein